MAEIQAKFFTKQEKYVIPDTPYVLSRTVTSDELDSLIKSVLKKSVDEEDDDIEFEFLICGELLRSSLGEHLDSRDVTAGNPAEIEYFEKYPAPSAEDSLIHDDWVSAVKASEEWILAGCYDDTIQIWSMDGRHKLTIPGHIAPVKSVAWIETGVPFSVFVSTSHDEMVMLWQWNQESNAVDCVHVCKGHARSIDCVDVNAAEHKFATGSYDQTLKIWSSDMLDGEESVSGDSDRKRFKAAEKKSKVKAPLLTLSGHTEGVSGVQWTDANEICTSSLDSTLRLWDVELGSVKTQMNGSKAFFDVSYSPISRLLVTASADRHVRLWDPRSKEGTSVKRTFNSHTGWVSAVKWSPLEEHKFVSSSYDHLVKLWDTRCASSPLFDLSGHEDKVLSVDWSSQNCIVSGGADNHVKVYRIQSGDVCSMD